MADRITPRDACAPGAVPSVLSCDVMHATTGPQGPLPTVGTRSDRERAILDELAGMLKGDFRSSTEICRQAHELAAKAEILRVAHWCPCGDYPVTTGEPIGLCDVCREAAEELLREDADAGADEDAAAISMFNSGRWGA